MAFSERFVDSYPYEMSPYGRHPYHACFGSGPSQCHHGRCDDGYFAGPGARAAYPYCVQQSSPFGHHGVYPQYGGSCRGPHEPGRYEYGPRNYGSPGSGCCNHSLGCSKKNFNGGEMNEVPCKKRTPNEFDAGRTRMLLDGEQEKFDMRNRSGTDYLQEYAEAWPWDHHRHEYDPLTRRMNDGNGRLKSPNASAINKRTCDGKVSRLPVAHPAERTNEAHPSKKVRTIEVKDVSRSDQNNGTGKFQIVAVEPLKSGKVLDVKLKKIYSDEEAAVLLQSVYRGYEVRRFNLLDKLKKIANIREQAVGVEGRIQSLLTSASTVDEKQRLVLEESIMSLLLKLDGVQGLPPQFREIRKSAARELTRMQERLDSLIMQKSEEVKDEEMSEALEQCVETNSEELKDGEYNEGTEVECGNGSCEDGPLEQFMDQDEPEIAKPDQATESLCAITDKEENDAGGFREEDNDLEKFAMSVEHEVIPVVEVEVNMEAEHEANPNVDNAGTRLPSPACPESVTTLDDAITDDAKLESGVSEMETKAPSVLPETEDSAQVESDVVEPDTRDGKEVLDGTLSCRAAVEHKKLEDGTIKGHEKLVKEKDELRILAEKLLEVTKEQSAVISDLNKRLGNLEKRLMAKQKSTKNKRNKK